MKKLIALAFLLIFNALSYASLGDALEVVHYGSPPPFLTPRAQQVDHVPFPSTPPPSPSRLPSCSKSILNTLCLVTTFGLSLWALALVRDRPEQEYSF